MRTVMIMKWDGVTSDQYDKVKKAVNWEGNPPKGAIFHVAAFTKNACHVTDIWESAEEFNTFVNDRLMPATQKVGLKGEPQIQLLPAHAIFVPVLQRLAEYEVA